MQGNEGQSKVELEVTQEKEGERYSKKFRVKLGTKV